MRRFPLQSLIALIACSSAFAQDYPNLNFTGDQAWTLISPDLSDRHFNQPIAIGDGLVLLGGNAIHEIWDVSDPFSPTHVSTLESPHHDGEAESHQMTLAKRGDQILAATISGLGVDLWDLTNPASPLLLSALELENINYGDNTSAVWGVAWQGDALYVGGTNTGLHLIDTSDLTDPVVVDRITNAEFGGVSAGPLFAVGNLLVITSPKDHRGLATLDISSPWDPALLDFEIPDDDTYIGGFYEGFSYTIDPFTTWDVTTDPTDIQLVASHETFDSEYFSFGDGYAFIGGMRPAPGVHKIDLSDPTRFTEVGKVEGRYDVANGILNDDQFALPIANLLLICDDEIRYGCVIGVHDVNPDVVAPEVAYTNPLDGAINQAITTRIGLSMSDQIDPGSVHGDSVVVTSLADGSAVSGHWGLNQTVLSFWPDQPLDPDTSYEILAPAGGLRDLGGNGLESEVRSVFSTGPDVAALHCEIAPRTPVEVGAAASLQAVDAPANLSWDYGDGSSGDGTHTWLSPGRYAVTLTVSDDLGQRSCAGTQIVHRPIPEGGATQAAPVHVDAERGRIWVVNPDNDSVSAVDAESLERLFEVEVGDEPRTVSQTDDGRIWTADRGSDTLTAIDPDSGEVLETVNLRWGASPFSVLADGDVLWVSLEQLGRVIRLRNGKQISSVDLPDADGLVPQIRGLALDPEGAVWASRFVSRSDRGEIYRLSPSGDLMRTVELRVDPGPDANDEGRGVPNYLGIAASPDGRRLLVPSKKDNVGRGLFRDGEPLDTDNTVRTILSVVDVTTGAEVEHERRDVDDRERLTAGVYSPVGDLIFAISQGTNQVDVFNAYDGRRVAGFGTGFAPSGLALEGGRLYVSDFLSRTLSVFDVEGLIAGVDTVGTRIAQVELIDEEALDPEVLLGKLIFYNANTREMNADGYISCATCHVDGMHDGQTWDFTDRGEGLRNTIDLRGKAGMGHGPVHWTANFDEIQDFENDIRHGFGGSGLLSDEDFELTSDTLGEPKAGLSERLDALAAYVESLDSFPRSPWRQPDGDMTEEALKGREIVERRCLDCHGGPALTDSKGAKGLHDVGTIRGSSGERRGGKLKGIDTPTLLGLWATAPYLHDGSAMTLVEVLENRDHVGRLSQRQREQVAAFLMQVEERDLPLEPRGCGCSSTSGGGWIGWLAGLWVVAMSRRRASCIKLQQD